MGFLWEKKELQVRKEGKRRKEKDEKKNVFSHPQKQSFWQKPAPPTLAAPELLLHHGRAGWYALAGSLGRDIDLIIALNAVPALTVSN